MSGSTAAALPVPAPRTSRSEDDLSSHLSSSSPRGSRSESRPRRPPEEGVVMVKKKRKAAAPPPPAHPGNIIGGPPLQPPPRADSESGDSRADVESPPVIITAPPAHQRPEAAPAASIGRTGARAKLRLLLGRKPSSASSVSVSAAAAGAGQSTLNPRASQQPRGLLHQSLAAINSTLVNSAASVPGRDVDISPVRPPSSLSNASTARTTHKKRRAPPPPVVLVLRKEAKKVTDCSEVTVS
jgi:hypothetical protein